LTISDSSFFGFKTHPQKKAGKSGDSDDVSQMCEAIINEVQSHPALWKKSAKGYSDRVIKSNIWRRILTTLEGQFGQEFLKEPNVSTVDKLKKVAKSLRLLRIEVEKSPGKIRHMYVLRRSGASGLSLKPCHS
jgi:hypothetical protein